MQNLSIPEAAARLGVSKHTLRGWLRRRLLAHFRLGRRVLVSEADLRDFLASRRVEARR